MKIKRVLTIAGSDSGGGAGIQADIKTITALGGFGMSVITALTAQNTLGVQGIHEVPIDFVEKQFDSVVTDIGVDAAKTGMLSNSEIMRTISRKVREYGIDKLVVDPVMVAKGGSRLIRDDAKDTLIKELLPLAFVITPNVPEAEELTGLVIKNKQDMMRAARAIHESGAKNVFVKGGHLAGDALDILFDGKKVHEFLSERFDTKDTHGTGCTTSAAIATGLAEGMDVYDAVSRAKKYISTAIRFSIRIGSGHGPTNHMAEVLRESDRYQCMRELKEGARLLVEAGCAGTIPEIRGNFGHALPLAIESSEVAIFPEKIMRAGGTVRIMPEPEFELSTHVSRIILTVMSRDHSYRSAAVIPYSDELIDICRQAGFDVGEFIRKDESRDLQLWEGSSLEKGIMEGLSRWNGIPDVIFGRGKMVKEPIAVITGRTPSEVSRKILKAFSIHKSR